MSSQTILLRCTHCHREVTTPRASYDPPAAVRGESPCPDCLHATNGRDPETFYYDADGNELNFDLERATLPDDFRLDAIYMTRQQKEREPK